MSRLLQRIHDIGAHAWQTFLQVLNAIAVGLFGGVILVYQTYPGAITNLFSKLSPWIGIPSLITFGIVVHYALGRAKKAGGA